jgi:histidine triad (HIT) family protein
MSTADKAAANASHADCLFCRIARGEIPSRKVYEDDEVYAFHDIQPKAPIHFMIVPKTHYENLYDAGAQPALLGRIFSLCGRLAREQGLDDGFRVVVNNGRVGHQEVYHLHVHILGGAEPLGMAMNRF